MTKSLRRWLWYVLTLFLVLFLCWQNSGDSGDLSRKIAGMCQRVLERCLGTSFEAEEFHFVVRKIGHGVAFLILSCLGHLAIAAVGSTRAIIVLTTSLMNIGVAVLAELFQTFSEGRFTTPRDALINILGASLGVLLGACFENLGTRNKIPS